MVLLIGALVLFLVTLDENKGRQAKHSVLFISLALLLCVLAVGSMSYGNLIALMQSDFKRLLGFSGIAHAGYALIGFVALSDAGYSAALYYMTGYLLMVLACFVVICQVSRDGTNVAISELAGLHRRAPLLAVTLAIGAFALAGLPPFVGFMSKLTLLTAAWQKGHSTLVILAMINAAIAVYSKRQTFAPCRISNYDDRGQCSRKVSRN